jgi:hypothetical protein
LDLDKLDSLACTCAASSLISSSSLDEKQEPKSDLMGEATCALACFLRATTLRSAYLEVTDTGEPVTDLVGTMGELVLVFGFDSLFG